MATIAGVFSLLGILLVVLGPDAEARQTGAMCVLFFGLGSVGYLGGPLLTRRGPGAIELDRAGAEPAFVFPAPRSKQLAQLIGAVGLAGGAALMYVMKGGWALGACAAVFGLFFLLALYRMARPMRLVITPTRVLVGSSEIRWEAIEDVDLYESNATGADSFAGRGEEIVEALKIYKRNARRRHAIGSQEELGRLHRLTGLAGRT